MKAELLLLERQELAAGVFTDLKVWRVPRVVRGSLHAFKYSLALGADDVCVLRYDNEAGKGDHRHLGRIEEAYMFRDIDILIADFWQEVDQWLMKHGR
ncbi:DUF6516 family protein [Jiella sp. M17.18]|uniref:toxin-antitoxin system TumE family protein n=1 Tax=Jiella sp. M17.18 TaxID=3234247 RepID=UPI0034E0529B